MEIREIQLYKLEMLKDFAELCKRNNLKYCLYGGTLLGAVRYGGYIPWDDVDVLMPWDDYKKFLNRFSKQLPDRYFVQNYRMDPCSPLLYTQFRVNNTTTMPVKYASLAIRWGICNDIFPPMEERGGHELQLGDQILDFDRDYSYYRNQLLEEKSRQS